MCVSSKEPLARLSLLACRCYWVSYDKRGSAYLGQLITKQPLQKEQQIVLLLRMFKFVSNAHGHRPVLY